MDEMSGVVFALIWRSLPVVERKAAVPPEDDDDDLYNEDTPTEPLY
jgi:hypothetical protein